ncbi:MAG: TetR/AcrR family transcriptional regulator [Methanobrevibacter sp.]|nr:TetR/AcrR family transcriptional regulator [Methanobrevibacter sp.]
MKLNPKNRKNKIINATLDLSLKHGFDNVSIHQIHEESGFASGTIYYYFKDKDEILEYMVRTCFIDSFDSYIEDIKNFEGTFIEKLRFILEYITHDFGTKNEPLYSPNVIEFSYREYFALFKSLYYIKPKIRPMFNELNKNLYDFYYDLFQEAIENKEIREDIEIETLVILFQTILKGYTDIWAFHENLSLEKIIDAYIKIIEEVVKKP